MMQNRLDFFLNLNIFSKKMQSLCNHSVFFLKTGVNFADTNLRHDFVFQSSVSLVSGQLSCASLSSLNK